MKYLIFQTLKIMLHKEKPKKKKEFRRDLEERPKRRMKEQKIKYRHSKAWLTEED